MRATRATDRLTRLTRARLLPINVYLVREDDGLTVVDTGLPGSGRGILEVADALDAPIRRIALTHAHVDHVGSLDALRAALPGLEVSVSERDARFLGGDRRLDPEEPRARLRGSYPRTYARPNRLLRPGDRVGSLEVVAAPGHTPGHVAFFDPRDRTLIAGDAFQTQGGIAVAGVVRWRFPLPALATWHKPTALASAEALRALAPARLAVGHGPILTDPLPAMDRAIAEAHGKLARVRG